ncbi:MAG: alpha/beta fold hydrolase [Bernardetiaceae bacterium]
MISHFVQISDTITLHYETLGESHLPPLVLLHGLTGSAEGYSDMLQVLQDHYYCLALDLPGHGQSSKGDYPYTLDFYLDCLQSFLQRLGLEQFLLCGHSMGGQIAIRYAHQHPHQVQTLILLAPAGFETFTPAEVQLIKGLSALPFTGRRLSNPTIKQWIGEEGQMEVIVRSARGMLEAPVWDILPELVPPTLVIFGSKDQLIPNPAVHRRLTTKQIALSGAKRIPKVAVRLIRDEGHFLHRSSGPLIAELILKHEGKVQPLQGES